MPVELPKLVQTQSGGVVGLVGLYRSPAGVRDLVATSPLL